jgi:hypothetical protein
MSERYVKVDAKSGYIFRETVTLEDYPRLSTIWEFMNDNDVLSIAFPTYEIFKCHVEKLINSGVKDFLCEFIQYIADLISEEQDIDDRNEFSMDNFNGKFYAQILRLNPEMLD